MSARSTRTSASRAVASSPIQPDRSTNTRSTRSTRNRAGSTIDTSAPPSAQKTTRSRRRREGSADSATSQSSNGSVGERKRKRTHARKDLHTVIEEAEAGDEEAELDASNEADDAPQSQVRLSDISGTTAATAQSSQVLAELDVELILEGLPDLATESFRMIELLLPDGEPINVEALVKELQIPGSSKGKRLRLREKLFESMKENYTNEHFIDPDLVLRKLFNADHHEVGDHRPDLIFFNANIAVLTKELLVAKQDNTSTRKFLQLLDNLFARPFLSPQYPTELQSETRTLALDIRTQVALALLREYRDEENFDPDQILMQIFCEAPESRDETLSVYDDFMKNGRFRKLAEISPEDDSQESNELSGTIRQRIATMRDAFRFDDMDEGGSDVVDFEVLEGEFPWNDFLGAVLKWASDRSMEVERSIKDWDASVYITRRLAAKVEEVNSQVSVDLPASPSQPSALEQPASQEVRLLPAAEITPAAPGREFNITTGAKLIFGSRRAQPSAALPPSNQQQAVIVTAGPNTAVATRTMAQPRASLVREESEDQVIRDDDDGMDDMQSQVALALQLHAEAELNSRKENIPVDQAEQPPIKRQRRFIDRQANAERVNWSQDPEDRATQHQNSRSRLREDEEPEVAESVMGQDNIEEGSLYDDDAHAGSEAEEEEEEEDDEDDAFQTQRPPSQNRRISNKPPLRVKQPLSQRRHSVSASPGPSTAHIPQEQQHRPSQVNDGGAMRPPPSSAPARNAPPSSSHVAATQAAAQAVRNQAAARPPPPAQRNFTHQKRLPWSIEETEELVRLIALYGSKWVKIIEQGQGVFAPKRDQVALKDKARNIKVDYLISGAALPLGFDSVGLGQKEIQKVKAVGYNPYRLVGEMPGQETYDSDGELRHDFDE